MFITFFYIPLSKNSFLLTLPSCFLFSPYQVPRLFLFSSLPTCPSQPTVFQSAFDRKPNVNISSYLPFSTSSMSFSQDKPSLTSSVLTEDNLRTILMASFRFTESPLRLCLDFCFSNHPTLPQVHPSSPLLKNLQFLTTTS